MIPFPIFPNRIITTLSMTPAAFDESELKRDIESDGLLVGASDKDGLTALRLLAVLTFKFVG
jgi:hypothetical protein